MTEWHALPAEEVLEALGTSLEGLSDEEAAKRLAKYGYNELAEERRRFEALRAFVAQFKNALMAILLAATVVSIFMGEYIDAATILAIVLVSAVLGFYQEWRAEKSLEAVKKLAAPLATVRRGGAEKRIPAREVVPGDVLVLSAGDKVAADARIIYSASLMTNEAPLTGESTPVVKSADPLPADTYVADRTNMVFAGTTVTHGRGLAVVVATGMGTELGKIAAFVREAPEEETPLERRIAQVGKWLTGLLVSVCAAVTVAGVMRGYDPIMMLKWGASLAVAAVPEALPAVVTGALAIGVYKMARRNAIVKRLPAVETLGSTTVICADKTGTMTKGEMTVRKVATAKGIYDVTGAGYEPKGSVLRNGEPADTSVDGALANLALASALCNDAKLTLSEGRWQVVGDPTEGALLVFAVKAGVDLNSLGKYQRVGEIPFSSERKRMTTINKVGNKLVAFMKGAPEVVIERCDRVLVGRRAVKLTEKRRAEFLELNEVLASRGYRNLAVAMKRVKGPIGEEEERGFTLLGLVAMMDPPRPEVKEAIAVARRAGIRTIMITGDHKLTAVAVAKELGLYSEGDLVITGAELDRMPDEELESIIGKVSVFARVSPEHKHRIVKALKRRGHIVAMTGDGVNDAPALKSADVGVAMGITGTEVAKEASHMVLADDNYATIVAAIEEGRSIFDNIKKYITYLLKCNLAEVGVCGIAGLAGFPLPLTAAQILWVNLVTDGLPAIALGVDPPDLDVMERPPRNPKESVFKGTRPFLAIIPLIMTALLLYDSLAHLPTSSISEVRTRLFTAFVFGELASAIAVRSLRLPVIKAGVFRNKFLIAAVAVSAAMQAAILLLPPLRLAFGLVLPTTWDIAWALAFSAAVFLSIEAIKLICRAFERS